MRHLQQSAKSLSRIARSVVLVAAAASLAAAPAAAQRLSVSIGKYGRHGSFGVTLDTRRPAFSGFVGRPGLGRPGYARPGYCAPRAWIPGRYETRHEQVWVAGAYVKEWVPPRYVDRYEYCGPYGERRRVTVLVREGYWRTVQQPGHHVTRAVKVWVPGHWSG